MSPISTGVPISLEDFCARIDSFDLNKSQHLQELTDLRISHPSTEKLNRLDPFSTQYRDAALSIYEDLKGARGYAPERDEKSYHVEDEKVFTGSHPWVVKDARYLSEFLFAWAQICRLLDVRGDHTILEYGPGAGEILLTLARAGFEVYGVDIDDAWLRAIQTRATAMGVPVRLEQARFGKGFEDRKFDRILFFEAFHHAFDFLELLDDLKSRLKPDGFIVFCGEPVLAARTDSVPYPWGPRLDGLSVYVTRQKGWMELGFTHEFFVRALRRAGYDVEFHSFPECGRACAYTAKPGAGSCSETQRVEKGHTPRNFLATLFARRSDRAGGSIGVSVASRKPEPRSTLFSRVIVQRIYQNLCSRAR